MEKSLSFLEKMRQEFSCKEQDLRTYSPLTLAFVGDCVFDLIIRTVIVERANRSPHDLHKLKSAIVKAKTQAELGEVLQEYLEQEELDIYRRGRNAKSGTTAKNATVGDYRKATALETLLGYLFLKNQEDRILYLVKTGLDKMNLEI